ncbi:MAG: beta-glucuronidase, partial [Cytophagales bacterium]|nr:beta-glucuronidase [Cytophagales bacterium]
MNLPKTLSIFFFLTLIISSQAQEADPLIQNVTARNVTTLNGLWQIIVDPLENGYYNHRYQPKENGFFMNQKMQSPSDLIEYNFDEGYQLSVPGDWNTQMEKLYYYEGNLWYKKSFDYTQQAANRVFLY